MTRRLVRTSFGATLLASLALGMYGAGGWVAAQIAPSDTGPSAREAAATLAAEAAEDAKLPRANGQSGGFEVTSDSAKYNVDLYFPCEPGYNTEFDPRPYRDSSSILPTTGSPIKSSAPMGQSSRCTVAVPTGRTSSKTAPSPTPMPQPNDCKRKRLRRLRTNCWF